LPRAPTCAYAEPACGGSTSLRTVLHAKRPRCSENPDVPARIPPARERTGAKLQPASRPRPQPVTAKLLKNGTLKTYSGFTHSMPTTQAETINADLLAFLRG